MSHTTLVDRIGRTPLVALARIGRDAPVPVLAKCEHLNPGGSVKDRIALAIVDDAEQRGYGLVFVMPEKMSEDKRRALRGVGARVVITPNAPLDDPQNFQSVARRMAQAEGWFLADQFRDLANPDVHERTTGPEILAQTDGQLSAFVAGAGTGGTRTGVGRCLRQHGSAARVVLADPIGSGLAQWVRSGVGGPDAAYRLEGIGASRPPEVMDRAVIHEAESVSDEESFAMTRRLWAEEGLYVGGSSGTAVVAALRVAQRASGGPVVVVLPDAWDRYASRDWAQ